MKGLINRFWFALRPNSKGMELVQVAILIAIAVVIGLLFSKQIMTFVSGVFRDLLRAKF